MNFEKHPWYTFLEARIKAILWMKSINRTDEQIIGAMCITEKQICQIFEHAKQWDAMEKRDNANPNESPGFIDDEDQSSKENLLEMKITEIKNKIKTGISIHIDTEIQKMEAAINQGFASKISEVNHAYETAETKLNAIMDKLVNWAKAEITEHADKEIQRIKDAAKDFAKYEISYKYKKKFVCSKKCDICVGLYHTEFNTDCENTAKLWVSCDPDNRKYNEVEE